MVLLPSCRRAEVRSVEAIDQLTLRLNREPENLSPVLSSSSFAREVHEYIYLSLCDYDPVTLEMTPVIAKNLPVKRSENGKEIYDFEILEDALWSDGMPITAYDYVFTMKMVAHPQVKARGWESLLDDLEDIIVQSDNKKFSLVTRGNYFLNAEAFMTAELLPAHIYDSEGVFDKYSYQQLKDRSFANQLGDQDSAFRSLGEALSSAQFTRDIIVGSGPYTLGKWEAGQYILLNKVSAYWGLKYPERLLLNQNVERILFQIIPENNTALLQLRNQQLSFMDLSGQTYLDFDDLQKDSLATDKFSFRTQATLRSIYLLLNTQSPLLSDVKVRKALAHLMNVDQLIQQVEGGYGTRIVSIIHPAKSAAHKNLKPIGYDRVKAETLLNDAGWIDTDGDGIRDKHINGQKTDLRLRFFISGSAPSEAMFAMLEQSASQAGIKIESIVKSNAKTTEENYHTGDYEIGTRVATPDLAPDDPYSLWHSTSIGQGGFNHTFFANAEADNLMGLIRMTRNEDERLRAYLRLQEIIYDEQPAIFLYSPINRYVIDPSIEPLLSLKRPGYFANAFTSRK